MVANKSSNKPANKPVASRKTHADKLSRNTQSLPGPGADKLPKQIQPSDVSFFGIDFGTAYSAIAWIHPATGHAEVICNAEGEEKTRSVVYFDAEKKYVGQVAEEYLLDDSLFENVIASNKREIAKNTISFIVDGQAVTPFDIAVEILTKLKTDAETASFHTNVAHAVITVPVQFDSSQREAVQKAANQVGFEVVEILDEPIAAALAYLKEGLDVGERMLVFDLGAGTFDATILDRSTDEHDPFHLAAKPVGKMCGGEDFDRLLMEYLLKELPEELSENENRPFQTRLLLRCRRLKEVLTQSETHPLSITLPDGTPYRREVQRGEFEKLIADDVDQMVKMSVDLVQDAVTDGTAVDTLVLIGGSSRIPLIGKRLLTKLKLKPRAWHRQDVAVALGAAYFGEVKWGAKENKSYREYVQRIIDVGGEPLGLMRLRQNERERVRLELSSDRVARIEIELLGGELDGLLVAARQKAIDDYQRLLREYEPSSLTNVEVESLISESSKLGLTQSEADEAERELWGKSKSELLAGRKKHDSTEFKRLLGQATKALNSERWGEALDSALLLIPNGCHGYEGFLIVAEVYAHKKKWESVVRYSSECLKVDASVTRALFLRADANAQQKSFEACKTDVDTLLAGGDHSLGNSEQCECHYLRALSLYHQKDMEACSADLHSALNLSIVSKGRQDRSALYVLRALILKTMGKWEDAVDHIAKLTSGQSVEKGGVAPLNPSRLRNQLSQWGCVKNLTSVVSSDDSLRCFLQEELWECCKQAAEKDVRHAIDLLIDSLGNTTQSLEPNLDAKLINDDERGPNVVYDGVKVGIAMVHSLADRKLDDEAKTWLTRLHERTRYDISELRDYAGIKKSGTLREFLKVKCTVEANSWNFCGDLSIKNESMFPLTSISVRMEVVRKDGTLRKVNLSLDGIGIDESKNWAEQELAGVFDNQGFLGGKIKVIQVDISSTQGSTKWEWWSN